MILDFSDDGGQYLASLNPSGALPSKVKLAAEFTSRAKLYDEDFALVLKTASGVVRRYPICDTNSTILSALYFGKYGSQLEPAVMAETQDKIQTAIRNFGIVGIDLPALDKTAAVNPATASLEDLFYSDDPSLELLQDHCNAASPRGQQRIMMQVKEAGVKAEGLSDAYLASEYGTDLGISIRMRKLALAEDSQKTILDGLLKEASKLPPADMVAALSDFDVENQLVHLYGHRLPDPYESVYGTTYQVKTAGVRFKGESLPADRFKQMIADKYTQLSESFGKEAADQLMSNPIPVFNSLPVPQKLAIEAMYE
jgi:hypothetical protein